MSILSTAETVVSGRKSLTCLVMRSIILTGSLVNRINSAKHPAFASGQYRANQRTVPDGTTIVYVTYVPVVE